MAPFDDDYDGYDDEFGNEPEGGPEDEQPLGDAIRDEIEAVFEGGHGDRLQLKILDSIFSDIALKLPVLLERKLQDIFNAAAAEAFDPDAVVKLLTLTDRQGKPLFIPVINVNMPISTAYTDFSPEKLVELPGYIKLHEAARRENVALSVRNLFPEDLVESSDGTVPPPQLIIDLNMSYDDGCEEDPAIYPVLPPLSRPSGPEEQSQELPKPPKSKKPKNFDL